MFHNSATKMRLKAYIVFAEVLSFPLQPFKTQNNVPWNSKPCWKINLGFDLLDCFFACTIIYVTINFYNNVKLLPLSFAYFKHHRKQTEYDLRGNWQHSQRSGYLGRRASVTHISIVLKWIVQQHDAASLTTTRQCGTVMAHALLWFIRGDANARRSPCSFCSQRFLVRKANTSFLHHLKMLKA